MKLTRQRELDYYVQTNDEVDAKDACQCAAMVNGLYLANTSYVKAVVAAGKYKQPEDCLRYYCETDPKVRDLFLKSHPGSDIHPAEWADCLVFATNAMVGLKVCYFVPALDFSAVLDQLNAMRRPVMASMRYPERRIPGHWILAVGNDGPDVLLCNDPWGKSLLDNKDGYECRYTREQWKVHHKGYGILYR